MTLYRFTPGQITAMTEVSHWQQQRIRTAPRLDQERPRKMEDHISIPLLSTPLLAFSNGHFEHVSYINRVGVTTENVAQV